MHALGMLALDRQSRSGRMGLLDVKDGSGSVVRYTMY
jgi:hypothetical protein